MDYMKSLQNLDINFNKDGWGPIIGEKSSSSFFGVPYSHFDKKEKLGRPADFTAQSASAYPRQHYPRRRDETFGATGFSHCFDAVEDSTFQLVDTVKGVSKGKHTGKHFAHSHFIFTHLSFIYLLNS
jgi:hypothetical protein